MPSNLINLLPYVVQKGDPVVALLTRTPNQTQHGPRNENKLNVRRVRTTYNYKSGKRADAQKAQRRPTQ